MRRKEQMIKMKIYEIIFSPTGGTKKAADIVADRFGSDIVLIDLTDRKLDFSSLSFEQEDICIVAVPSYGGRIPQAAGERLREKRLHSTKATSATALR